jgi:hypothetical protein
MKVQNQVSFKQHVFEFPLNEMSTLYMPDLFFEPSSAISIEEQEETEDFEEAPCSSSSRPVSVPGLIDFYLPRMLFNCMSCHVTNMMRSEFQLI